MNRILMRKRLLASTTIAGAVMIAMPGYAQTTQEAPTTPAASNPAPSTPAPVSADGSQTADTSSGENIVVTGSRIPHPELESASPVTIVGAQEVKQSGTTRVEDLLNALPQVFAGQGGNVSNGATGTATVDLRNLGPSRTLVLVNGRRLVPGDPRSPVADINIIPAALIKRVDVLTGGASSVYGADAVSGVVNFVMDTEFSGFKIDSQTSLYNHNNRAGNAVTNALNFQGRANAAGNLVSAPGTIYGYPTGVVSDGAAIDVTAVIGAGFDDNRGHVTAYGSYRKINAVTQDKRDYSSCSLTALNNATVTARPGYLYGCGGSATSAPGSFYAQGQYYNVQGNQFVPGQVLYNFAPTNYYQRPDERYTAGFFAHYDVSDSFKPYMEFMFMDDRTVAQIAPSGNFFNTTTINCGNPLLSTQQRNIACAAGNTFVDSAGVTRGNLYIARRNVEGGGRQDDLQHTTYRGLFGAKGDIAAGLSYDASYQYSRVNFAQTYRNDFSVTRLTRAIDVVSVNSAGAIVAPNTAGSTATCRSVVDGTDPACVPYNIFTTGGVTAAALNYLQIPLFSRGQTTEQIANASLTFLGGDHGLTSPFATEGLGLNVGGEYRKETLNFEVDSNFLSGDGAGQGGPTTPVAGTLSVKEAFVEASLPLIQDRAFFQDLRIGAGYRKSYYTTAGLDPATNAQTSNKFNTDTYKVEGSWQPVRDIKFRASYNHAVRAPNAVELFGARSFGLDGSTDPCAGPAVGATAGQPGTGTVNGYTFAQCARTGVTAGQFGSVAANPAAQYNGFLGGNAKLTPEIANSITAGAVFTPTFLRGFQLTVDYFDIKLSNQISTYGADSILNQCVTTGDAFYCSLIKRNAGGNLFRGTPTLASGGYVFDTNVNAGKLRTSGIDVTLGYTQELGSMGTLGASLAGTYLDKLIVDAFGPPKFDCAGYYGAQCGIPSPKWRHKLRLTYTSPSGPSISGAWRYFAPVKNEALSPDTDLASAVGSRAGNSRISAVSYFDLALTVPVADKFTFRLGSNNILDKAPPITAQGSAGTNGNTYSQVYDALGRYLYASVTLDL
ncbi:TonB-dependent receptor domain-containing protein [Sphingomonas sp. GB1N7]|uniref:TonB-dependent receptor domain-containing protein n=1 Tax=Parasphingomonas caseinilytica TaxID=3096158 RepID=UPI002FC7DC06